MGEIYFLILIEDLEGYYNFPLEKYDEKFYNASSMTYYKYTFAFGKNFPFRRDGRLEAGKPLGNEAWQDLIPFLRWGNQIHTLWVIPSSLLARLIINYRNKYNRSGWSFFSFFFFF